MKYENRIVCFLDILGFQELINNTIYENGVDNTNEIDNLGEVLKNIRNLIQSPKGYEEKNGKQVTQFSDSIVFSFLVSEESEVYYALLEIQWTLANLIFKKILCRGGIAMGKLIHTKELLFGPALIKAYHYESKCANYPRVILPEEIISVGKQFHGRQHSPDIEEKYIRSLIEKDSDGMYYIDYFRSIQSEFNEPYEYRLYLDKLSKIIRAGLHSENPAIKIKYLWMKEKYNSVINDIKKNLDKQNTDTYIRDVYKTLLPL